MESSVSLSVSSSLSVSESESSLPLLPLPLFAAIFPASFFASASSSFNCLILSSACLALFRLLHNAQNTTPTSSRPATAMQKICHHDSGPIASPVFSFAIPLAFEVVGPEPEVDAAVACEVLRVIVVVEVAFWVCVTGNVVELPWSSASCRGEKVSGSFIPRHCKRAVRDKHPRVGPYQYRMTIFTETDVVMATYWVLEDHSRVGQTSA